MTIIPISAELVGDMYNFDGLHNAIEHDTINVAFARWRGDTVRICDMRTEHGRRLAWDLFWENGGKR